MNIPKDNDEDFWNSNEKHYFCFDKEDQEASINRPENLRPLLSVISEKTLHCIIAVKKMWAQNASTIEVLALDKIENVNEESNNICIEPDITLRKILMGQSYSLETYKSLASKTALLNSAVRSGNGNAIIIIVLFLKKTLKKSLVYRLLAERPEAVNVYIHYLSVKLETNEITDILSMLGQSENCAMINLQIILKNIQDCDKLLHKLRNCYKTQFFNLIDCKETQFLNSYIQLLEWYLAVKNTENGEKIETNCSVLDFLRYICTNDKYSSQSALMFSQQHNVSLEQYHKIIIKVKASLGEWESIDHIFLTKGWRGNIKLQTSLSVEDIVKLLHKAHAPLNVIEKYLKYVDNIDKRLELAKSFNCYRIAIDIFVEQGDKTALLEYKNKLQPQSEEYFYAANALRIPSVKWKSN